MPKQHYLAQCYLKGFAARHYDNDNEIWQYRKSNRILKLRGIGNVAKRSNYYSREFASGKRDDSVDDFFGALETLWPSLRDRLESLLRVVTREPIQPISPENRTHILQFILAQDMRVPDRMAFMRNYTVTKHPRRDALTEREVRNYTVEGLRSTYNHVLRDWLRCVGSKPLVIVAPPAGSGVAVVTSDNPVSTTGDIRDNDTCVLFPVSRRIFVQFGGTLALSESQAQVNIARDTSNVDKLNYNVIKAATDEVYAPEPCYLKGLLKQLGLGVEIQYPSSPVNRTRQA